MKRVTLYPATDGVLGAVFRNVDVLLDSECKRIVIMFELRNGRRIPLGGQLEPFEPGSLR